MLTLNFIILTAAAYSLCVFGDEDTCMKREVAECDENLLPEHIPKTVNEGKNVCRDIITLGDCILKVRETCSGNSNVTDKWKQAVGYVKEACQEDSPIFKVISSNIECISSVDATIRNLCIGFNMSESTRQLILNSTHEYHKGNELAPEEKSCLENMWMIGCPSISVTMQCGKNAGLAVLDVLKHSTVDEMCTQELLNQFRPMIDIFKKAIHQEITLKKNS